MLGEHLPQRDVVVDDQDSGHVVSTRQANLTGYVRIATAVTQVLPLGRTRRRPFQGSRTVRRLQSSPRVNEELRRSGAHGRDCGLPPRPGPPWVGGGGPARPPPARR